jgi:hypothetical protein
MMKALNHGHVGTLMMLSLSAAFETVDPLTLQDVMRRRFRVCQNALNWLVSFLKGRMQVVQAGVCESAVVAFKYGIS